MRELKSDYDKRISSLEEQEQKKYNESHRFHQSQIESENHEFHSEMKKEKDTHANEISALQEERTKSRDSLKRKTDPEIKPEYQKSQHNIHQTKTTNKKD